MSRPRDDRWHSDRLVLIGDACHPMRPFMAAGGAMAIEDPQTAFARYAAGRIPRVARGQQISIDNSWMRGPTDVNWFYAFDPFEVELEAAASV